MERILSSINVAVQTEKSHTKNRNFVPITYLAHTNKFMEFWAGELAQGLRALAAPPDDLSSIPSKHMVTHNHL